MKTSSTVRAQWPLCLLLLAIAVSGARWGWIVSRSPSGWRPVVDQWIAGGRSLAGFPTKLQDQDPAEQARFWLAAVPRVPGAADDPQMALGAAWMLDSPQLGWISRHVRMREGPFFESLPRKFRRELDQDAITALVQEFESQCRNACLAHIETATRLDSSDTEAWRARALLLFEAKLWEMKLQPRREDWLAVLAECAEHDPENALYDYLAALHLWRSSTTYDVNGDGWDLTVHDEGQSAEAKSRVARGLAKPHLRFGTDGPRATLRFLERTRLGPSEQLSAAGSRQIDLRATTLLYSLTRWQNVVLDVEARKGNLETAAGAARNTLAIVEQVTDQGNSVELSSARLVMRRWSLAYLKKLSEDHPDFLTADAAARLSADRAAVRLEFGVHQEACRRLAAKAGVQTTSGEVFGTRARWSKDWITALLAGAAQMLVLVTLVLAAAAWMISRFGKPSADSAASPLGWFRSILAWCLGVGLSFGLLGVLPATVPPALWSEARTLHLDADELRSALNLEDSRWSWALLHWYVHDGPVGAALISVGLLIVWQFLRRARREGGMSRLIRSAKRSHLRLAGETVARSCAVASLAALLAYFAVAPTLSASMGDSDQIKREWLTNPAHGWSELARVTAEIRSDETVMNKLQKDLAAEDRRLAEQESE